MKNKYMVYILCIFLVLGFSYVGSTISNLNFWAMVFIVTLEASWLVSFLKDFKQIVRGTGKDDIEDEIMKVRKNANKHKRKWKQYRNVKK